MRCKLFCVSSDTVSPAHRVTECAVSKVTACMLQAWICSWWKRKILTTISATSTIIAQCSCLFRFMLWLCRPCSVTGLGPLAWWKNICDKMCESHILSQNCAQIFAMKFANRKFCRRILRKYLRQNLRIANICEEFCEEICDLHILSQIFATKFAIRKFLRRYLRFAMSLLRHYIATCCTFIDHSLFTT